MNYSKKLFTTALLIVILISGLFILKDYNMTWIEVEGSEAALTINFLFPMDQEAFKDSIIIENQVPGDHDFKCKIHWINKHTVLLELSEHSKIKGQRIDVHIKEAPTQYGWLRKNERIPVQFKEEVEVLNTTSPIVMASDGSIELKFNTPMNPNKIHRYIKADAKFEIQPIKEIIEGKEQKDYTKYKLTPSKPLKNKSKYLIYLKKGMPALSKMMLEEDVVLTIETGVKPLITEIYPKDGSKWVGLYPRITLHTDQPVEKAYLMIEDLKLEGVLHTPYKASFILPDLLEADRTYKAHVQVETKIGEKSMAHPFSFTTVPLDEERMWIEVILDVPQKLKVYQGKEVIKEIICSGGKEETPTHVGTFYVQSKGEKFFDEELGKGANYWLRVSDFMLIHGSIRDAYWNMIYTAHNQLGNPQTNGYIMVSESDAQWLFDHLPLDTMIIVRRNK